MKFALVFTTCLLLTAGSDAFLDVFIDVGHELGDMVKPVGEELLISLKKTGTEILSNTVQGLLFTIGGLFEGKREINLEKVESVVKAVENFISDKADNFKHLFHAAVDKLSSVESRVKSLEYLKEPIHKLVTEVEELVAGHNINADALLGSLASEVKHFLTPLFGAHVQKRGILDSLGLNQIGQTLANLFKPHIDSLKTLVSSAGNTLKTHATNLLGAVKGSVNELGSKLSTHVDTLKTHLGTITSTAGEALATLKDAIGQVMHDTFSSLHNPITGIVNTLTNAAGTIVGHITSKLNPTTAP